MSDALSSRVALGMLWNWENVFENFKLYRIPWASTTTRKDPALPCCDRYDRLVKFALQIRWLPLLTYFFVTFRGGKNNCKGAKSLLV
jgi:hypothetical protein